jgi:ribonuclease D
VKNSDSKLPVELIDTGEKLVEVVEHIKLCADIFIDTEFDDFNTQYGIHLQLIQIFDGTSCFLIDPIAIKNLAVLWAVFENENICKVLYSGANDVGVLKKYGCNTKNLFDIQVAASLCNRSENSFAALLHAELGVEIDKSQQRSSWDNRPLEASQVLYACNDVIYLPRLKEIFLGEINKKNIGHVLQEENILLASSIKKDYEPKLKGSQKTAFNKYGQTTLMEFKILINSYAKLLNVPPFYIVRDSLLEKTIKDKAGFLDSPFLKGFHTDVLSNAGFKEQFLAIVHSIDTAKVLKKWEKEKIVKDVVLTNYSHRRVNNKSFLLFEQYLITRYGEVAATFMLRGLSKLFTDEVVNWEGARQYQRDLYNDFITSFAVVGQ